MTTRRYGVYEYDFNPLEDGMTERSEEHRYPQWIHEVDGVRIVFTSLGIAEIDDKRGTVARRVWECQSDGSIVSDPRRHAEWHANAVHPADEAVHQGWHRKESQYCVCSNPVFLPGPLPGRLYRPVCQRCHRPSAYEHLSPHLPGGTCTQVGFHRDCPDLEVQHGQPYEYGGWEARRG